jgi:plasmid stabilization system protein ParE
MELEFHPDAELELLEAAFRYNFEVQGLGVRFAAEVERTTQLLLEHPRVGSEVGGGRRKLSLQRFPFTLFYVVNGEVLQVLAVAHDKRKPGYWRGRA